MNFFISMATKGLIAVTLIAAMSAASTPAWKSPLENGFHLISPFDLPNGPYSKGHRGIDLVAHPDQLVTSPTSGVVSFVGIVANRPIISITFQDKNILSIEPVQTELQVGDKISVGDIIGIVGTGGHCNLSCIHIGIRIDNKYFNPLRWFRKHPVLLP